MTTHPLFPGPIHHDLLTTTLRADHVLTLDRVLCAVETTMGVHTDTGRYHVKWCAPGLTVRLLITTDGLLSVSTQVHRCMGYAEWYGFETLEQLVRMISHARAVARGV